MRFETPQQRIFTRHAGPEDLRRVNDGPGDKQVKAATRGGVYTRLEIFVATLSQQVNHRH
ncbi:hypothetical protein E2C01_095737 [Portunus trituberculatus]|uniref:Uncharacterized protein n=1 Tax=Portunus trituberculatus TaxID=210409 RepID=A0A5B7K062_PORTR|nr:hypothetical protein [Portunus trituberculatus]